jgi:voltage-gated potassium channel
MSSRFATRRYTAALYWAATTMSTTGYGDILPLTNLERSYALTVMLVGVVVAALVFGVLAQIITEMFNDSPTSAQHQSEVRCHCTPADTCGCKTT